MKTFRLLTVLLLALPLPVACGGSSDGPGGGSGSIAKADAPAVFADTICSNVGHCCDDAGYAYDAAACKQMYTGELADQWNVKDTTFDADAAGRCLDLVKQALSTCGDIPGNECQGVIKGTLPEGAACTTSASCVAPAGGDAHCDDVCVQEPRGKTGDGCFGTCTETANSRECSGGSSGEGSSGTASCYTNDGIYCAESGKCEALLKTGDACIYEGCPAGNYCDEVCTPTLALGAACSGYEACGAKAYCDDSTNVCVAKKPVGAACQNYDECLESYCDDSNKCPPPGPASEETCSGK